MKTTYLWVTSDSNAKSSGFSAYPAGYVCEPIGGCYSFFGEETEFWTSTKKTQVANDLAYRVQLLGGLKDIFLDDPYSGKGDFRYNGLSIRCIEN
jgi:uncharacterized protein (TIGR02145 family)